MKISSNDYHGLSGTYFIAGSNLATYACICENVTMMDSLKILQPVTWELVYIVNQISNSR